MRINLSILCVLSVPICVVNSLTTSHLTKSMGDNGRLLCIGQARTFTRCSNPPHTSTAMLALRSNQEGKDNTSSFRRGLNGFFLAASLTLGCVLSLNTPVNAFDSSRVIGEIQGSGLVFKDTLLVESFDDPKVQGVSLYITNFQRPLAERIQKGFFTDPSAAALGCAKTGPVKIADNIAMGKQGEEVFEESKSLLFKTLRVQRIYDKEKGTVVYVTYNTRLNKNDDTNKSRFKSGVCAVSLE
mmetsp:Transcript_33415/g.40470  ORF Transcript_33415/g.40470 Transcript_33415/m.40470 type:complete len:242 (+) Transcript_33415:67-792(+)